MKQSKTVGSTLFLLLIGCIQLFSQEAISSSGGEASSADGTVSYTVGQVLYSTYSSADGSVAHGVQQAYEISVSDGIEEAAGVNLAMTAFPNPTIDRLTLSVEDYNNENLAYQLYDIAGKLVRNAEMKEQNTIIYMEDLERGTYLLLVNDDNRNIKTFKIIKN